jgi:glycerol dehydrogenase-like iron-containing ADH family enzyme
MKILLITSKSNLESFKKHYDSNILVDHQNFKNIMENYQIDSEINLIYGYGGGTVLDVSKLIANKFEKKLIIFPTILSTSAFLTNKVAYFIDNTIKYYSTKTISETVYDDDILKNANIRFHSAGWAELISSLIACYCWRNYNKNQMERLGKVDIEYSIDIDMEINTYLNKITCPNNEENRLQLFNTFKRSKEIEDIYNYPIHSKSAEHYFVYNLRNYYQEKYLNGEALALGILLMASIENKSFARKCFYLMKKAGVKSIMPTKEITINTLKSLPEFVNKNKLNYSTIDTDKYKKCNFNKLIDNVYQMVIELNQIISLKQVTK